jgi:hypothetical protein
MAQEKRNQGGDLNAEAVLNMSKRAVLVVAQNMMELLVGLGQRDRHD